MAGNPLWKKLGIKEGHNCFLFHSPADYFDLLEFVPPDAEFTDELSIPPYDFMHAFVTRLEELEKNWNDWKRTLKKDGMLWISWPKGGSTIPTDLNGSIVREYGLQNGLVDVKVCAVDKVWSGLKLMIRKKDR